MGEWLPFRAELTRLTRLARRLEAVDPEAVLVAEMAKLQARTIGGPEDFSVTREFKALATDEQKLDVLRAWPVEVDGDRVVVDAELLSDGIITATCRGTFVAVGPDHPAFERW